MTKEARRFAATPVKLRSELDGQNVAYEIFVSFGQGVTAHHLESLQLVLTCGLTLYAHGETLGRHSTSVLPVPKSGAILWDRKVVA